MKKTMTILLLIFISFFSFNLLVTADEKNNISNNIKIEMLKKKYDVVDKTGKKRNITGTENTASNSGVIKCKDIDYLHKIWVVIEIAAPILVIVFGSFDFFAAIIAGDEKKMLDARKKFPKRLIAAIFIFMAFTIVNIVIGTSRNKGVKDNTLIKCIVNGK